MDAHFGQADDLAQVAEAITSNQAVFRTMPAKRVKGMENNPVISQSLGVTANTRAAFIDDFEIDFLRYKVPPNEKDCLIPQQLLMMQTADHAARDAGLKEGAMLLC